MNNATPIEITWFLIGLLGLLAALWNTWDALLDWLWLRNGRATALLWHTARANMYRAGGFLTVTVLMTAVGWGAMIGWPRVSLQAMLLAMAMVLVAMIIMEVVTRRTAPLEEEDHAAMGGGSGEVNPHDFPRR